MSRSVLFQGSVKSGRNEKAARREKRKYRCRVRSPETVFRAKRVRRSKANERERRRMHSLNDALEQLRKALPQLPDEPKLTKIGNFIHNFYAVMQICTDIANSGRAISRFMHALLSTCSSLYLGQLIISFVVSFVAHNRMQFGPSKIFILFIGACIWNQLSEAD